MANADRERFEHLLFEANRKLDDIGWRLVLAQSFAALMVRAYDALQYYGVDYRKLRTYPLWDKVMPEGVTFDNPSARTAISGWLTRIGNDIDAAIRRKTNIKEVNLGPRLGYEEEDPS